MLRRLALALIGVIVATFALAQTPSENILRMNAGIHPTYYCNYTNGSFCGGESYSGPSLRTITDATGAITYAPNNLLTYSNTFSNAAWNKVSLSVTATNIPDPLGGNNAETITSSSNGAYFFQQINNVGASTIGISSMWIRRRSGSGQITLATPNDVDTPITVTSSWQQFYFVSSAGLSINGHFDSAVSIQKSGDAIDVYAATISAVTYETTPRPSDQVITTSATYYGPAFDINTPSVGARASGLRDEAAATNLYLNSNAPATQTITVVDGTTYTGSILGTGTQAFTGAFTATLIGTANTLTQTTQAAATVTSLVATDTSLTATAYPQVEVGSFATSRIITGASSVTRAADTIGVTGLLAALVVTNPVIVEQQSIATGVISRTLYAKNTFAFAQGYWYRKLAAYPTTTPTSVLNQIVAMQRPMP